MYEFDTPTPIQLFSRSSSGRVTITASDVATTTVELSALRDGQEEGHALETAVVEQRGDSVVIEVGRGRGGLFRGRPRIAIDVVVPTGSDAVVETDSADIRTRGVLGRADLKTGSGEIDIEAADTIEVKSGSGDVEVTRCVSVLDVKTGSGEVGVGRAAERSTLATGSGSIVVDVTHTSLKTGTGSGDVLIRKAEGEVAAKSGSGDLEVRTAVAGRLSASTASGDVEVGVAGGTAAWLDLKTVTGDVQNQLDDVEAPAETDRTIELRIKTATGDIDVRRA